MAKGNNNSTDIVEFYVIEVITIELKTGGPPRHEKRFSHKEQVSKKYQVTNHVITSHHLSFGIYNKDEFIYIPHYSIVNFKLIGAQAHQKGLAQLKKETKS